MIILINEIVYNLIRAVKNLEQFSTVKFLRSYPKYNRENPLTGYTAVVGVSDIKPERSFVGGMIKNNTPGEVASFRMKIRLFGGAELSGSELRDTAAKLAEKLRSVDNDGFIDKVSVLSVKPEGDNDNLYEDIEAYISYNDCGAAQ
jgi:hypothetical protein